MPLRFAAPVLLLIALLCWGYSSPIGSSPDDDYHLASIWCGLGEREGLCEAAEEPSERRIPVPFTAIGCYTYHPQESAACFDDDERRLVATTRVDAKGSYPPVFYGTMSLFASENVPLSVLMMRAFNAILAVGLLTALFWTLPRFARAALVVSVGVTSVPLTLFIIPSTNPSSWAILASAVIWVATWGAFRTRGPRQYVLSGFVLFATVLGAGARADAAVFAVFGILLGAVLGMRRRSSLLVPSVAIGLSVIIAGLFYLSAGQSDAVVTGLSNTSPPLTPRQLVENLLALPNLWVGALGGWGLGWLDTRMPEIVVVSTVAVAGGALFIGLKSLSWRRGLALGLAGAALWAVPFVLLVQSNALVGAQVQPRYLLPLMIMAAGLTAATPLAQGWWRGGRQIVASAALTIAASVALHINIRRYTTGVDDASFDPGADAEWWWWGVPPPLVVWVVGTLAVAGFFAVILWGSGTTPTAGRTASPTAAPGHSGRDVLPASGDGEPSASEAGTAPSLRSSRR